MLNIFAEALLLATGLGRHTPYHQPRRSPRELMEIEPPATTAALRQTGR